MKYVVRTIPQAANLYDRLLEALKEGDQMVDLKPHKPPRTLKQSRKIHAMLTDLGNETGDSNFKSYAKSLSWWPHVYVEHFGKPLLIAKSEADLSKEESSAVIEQIFLLGAFLPDFKFNE